VQCEHGAKGFVLIPEGAFLTVESLDATGRLVRVRWSSQVLLMFWQDLQERGTEITEPAAMRARVANQLP
jgi:malate synthase